MPDSIQRVAWERGFATVVDTAINRRERQLQAFIGEGDVERDKEGLHGKSVEL
jgi:hypothetical protein